MNEKYIVWGENCNFFFIYPKPSTNHKHSCVRVHKCLQDILQQNQSSTPVANQPSINIFTIITWSRGFLWVRCCIPANIILQESKFLKISKPRCFSPTLFWCLLEILKSENTYFLMEKRPGEIGFWDCIASLYYQGICWVALWGSKQKLSLNNSRLRCRLHMRSPSIFSVCPQLAEPRCCIPTGCKTRLL